MQVKPHSCYKYHTHTHIYINNKIDSVVAKSPVQSSSDPRWSLQESLVMHDSTLGHLLVLHAREVPLDQ